MFSQAIRRLAASAVVVAIGGASVLPAVSARHLLPDPDDGLLRIGAHQPEAVASDAPAADEHCPVCHWLHAISGASVQPAASAAWLVPAAGPVAAATSDRKGREVRRVGPSRAPPALLT